MEVMMHDVLMMHKKKRTTKYVGGATLGRYTLAAKAQHPVFP
jgi:hypothetical protein